MSSYKTPIKEIGINIGGDEIAKAEKIIINETNQEELRFSWWSKDGKQFNLRPLDLPERQWIELFDAAIKNDIVSQEFIKEMIKVLAHGLK